MVSVFIVRNSSLHFIRIYNALLNIGQSCKLMTVLYWKYIYNTFINGKFAEHGDPTQRKNLLFHEKSPNDRYAMLMCLMTYVYHIQTTLQWRHNGHDSVSNHQPHDCFLNRLFRRRSKKTSKLRVTGHCAGNSPGTDEFPAKMASNAENVSIWWRHHEREVHGSHEKYHCSRYSPLYHRCLLGPASPIQMEIIPIYLH